MWYSRLSDRGERDLKHPEQIIHVATLKKNGSFVKTKKATIDKLNNERKKWKGETILMEKTLESLAIFMRAEIKIIL